MGWWGCDGITVPPNPVKSVIPSHLLRPPALLVPEELEFGVRLEGAHGTHVQVALGYGLVVLLGHVGVHVGEGVHRAVGWHHRVRPDHQVLDQLVFLNVLQGLVVGLVLFVLLRCLSLLQDLVVGLLVILLPEDDRVHVLFVVDLPWLLHPG